ncbi:hypothetical protein CA606_12180 [Caulobacter vibrioides]|uniref:Uncharacterized protein n=1 Tax=Caulobacter vibrioides TaxID=155892 RepID=A0A290MT49_CAUVI|nr:hypothetical protein [Caulobacter vibrioides]ATC33022.1 hypothetical protein CA606_12180 [Caulobacter vibrioides]
MIDALNYPYIRVRDVEWLKKTLLLFPHVARMTPPYGRGPRDQPDIEPFAWKANGSKPLLRPADLTADFVVDAQRAFQAKLAAMYDQDTEGFRHRFAVEALPEFSRGMDFWDDREDPHTAFQLHGEKLFYELRQFLELRGLAREPRRPHSRGYVEVHPELGRAIMTTLALACAANEGLEVITEFPDMHGRVLSARPDMTFEDLINPPPPAGDVNARTLGEFLVYQRCNVDGLDAAKLVEIAGERAAFAKFRTALQVAASQLPKVIHDPRVLEEQLNDTVNDIFADWQADKANFGKIAKAVFDVGALAEPAAALKKIAERAFGPIATGITANYLGGIGTGLVVGVAVHVIGTYGTTKKAEQDSPWKYLSYLDRMGVGFSLVR